MICVKCKKEIPDEAPFCCWCGKRQTPEKRTIHRRARGTGSIMVDKRNHKRPYIARAVPLLKGTRGAYIGSFATRKEAQAALEAYEAGKHPDLYNATLADIYALWGALHFPTVSDSSAAGYKAAYNSIADLSRLKMRDLKTADYQTCIDTAAASGASGSKLSKIKILCSLLCKYAMQNDIIDKDYASFVKLPKAEKKEKTKFSAEEIEKLWQHKQDKRVQVILVMIYTGFRIGELCALKPSDVHEKYMIGGEKTEAGKNRVVPFPPNVPAIKDFVAEWLKNCSGKTILGVSSRQLRENSFYPALAELGMIQPPTTNPKTGKPQWNSPRLTPHSTRHTFASLSAAAGMPPEILQKIIGHADYSTTADIYIHQDIETLIAGMELIKK